MAVFLPIGVIGYPCFQDRVEYGEKLAAYSNQYVHFRFALINPALKVSTILGHYSDGPHRKYPNKSPHILIASMTHSRMFRVVLPGLKSLGAPAEM